jgi:ubiquinone/menaquinone biosynthesis C-methylase UbiE
MNPTNVFSSKAEIYAKYRWSYAPDAIQEIVDVTRADQRTIIADIGAGTGILTKEFIGKVKQIYAIEPNPEMRAILQKEMEKYPSCTILGTQAEETKLESNSIDVITAAQAVHWFDPEKARAEFYRILKPGGWIVICRNYGNDPVLGKSLQNLYPAETDTEAWMIGKSKPRSFYFGDGEFVKKEYPNRNQANWDEFLGGLLTASFAPDIGSIFYENFMKNAKRVFAEFSIEGLVDINSMTEVYIGQIN